MAYEGEEEAMWLSKRKLQDFRELEQGCSMKKRARVLVSGLVQGVFYRAAASFKARRHGVVGFARNLIDGRVEVVLEGEEASVLKMIEWCREGPPSARVEGVTVEWSEPANELHSFTCR